MHLGMFQAEEFGDLQRLVDGLFTGRETIERLDLIVQAEILDLAPDLLEIVNLSLIHISTQCALNLPAGFLRA